MERFCVLTWVVAPQVCASEKQTYELCHQMSTLNCLHAIRYLERRCWSVKEENTQTEVFAGDAAQRLCREGD